MTKLATKDYREQIRIAVSEGHGGAKKIAEVTGIKQCEVTRLLNLLWREPGSGVERYTRGHYHWNRDIPKPNVEKQKTILDWLKTPIAWSIRK